MSEDGLSEFESKDLSQVSSIHFGLNRHHSLYYLLEISKAAKQVGILRDKVIRNQKYTHQYERQMWQFYRQVTKLKEQYYKIKDENWQPEVINAYVTFRDI